MARSGHSRGTILLLILQAWIVPCHGFAFVPLACKPVLSSSHHVAAISMLCDGGMASTSQSSVAVVGVRSGGAVSTSRLNMSGRRGDPPLDEQPPTGKHERESGPGPYREEHDSGGSRFRDLLARAKKIDPSVEQRAGMRPSPQSSPTRTPQQGAPPAARARPVRPANAPNYDDPDSWDRIGSPDLPDPPLRNEMPGMQLPREMDYDAGGVAGDEGNPMGGNRFRNMMNQARANDQRRQMEGPAGSRRDAENTPRPQFQHFSPEDKARATRAAVERQQKHMMKSRGIDLDDATLEGAELAKLKAISRAQAEAQSGYVPSSSAADDYLDELKKDSKKRNKLFRSSMEDDSVPQEPDYPNIPEVEQQQPQSQRAPDASPRRRTKATTSIQNESDAYIAALSGIKVEITKNPYLDDQSTTNFIDTAEDEPAAVKSKVLQPPLRVPRPTGPNMSYAERLRKAREEKGKQESGGAVAGTQPPSTPVQTLPPQSPPAPTVVPALSYMEKLKQARESKAAAGGGVPTQIHPPPPPADVETSRGSVEAAPERAGAAVPVPSRVVQQQQSADPFLGVEEDGPETKIMRVMDLLTEHKTASLVGEARVAELRDTLVDAREALRTETYGGSPPPVTATPQTIPTATPPLAIREQPSPVAEVTPNRAAALAAVVSTAARSGDKETLRRCSALVQAHAHSSLLGNDLMALREKLIATLTIVENQIDNGGLFEDAWSVGDDSGVLPPPLPPAGISDQLPGESAPPSVDDVPPVPASIGGIQSVGGVLSDMGVGHRPTSFEEETAPTAPPPAAPARMSAAPVDMQTKGRGWTDGSLGEYEKSVATRGLGYLLKHRGGTGYGRGRVKDMEAENMIVTLAELTEILHDEMVEN